MTHSKSAFPFALATVDGNGVPLRPNEIDQLGGQGMTLLEYYAGQALVYYLPSMPIVATYDELAQKCVRAAEALCAELERRQKAEPPHDGDAHGGRFLGDDLPLDEEREGHLDGLAAIAERDALTPAQAAADDMLAALKGASHALRSYQYGNASTELAASIADRCDAAIAKAEGRS